MKRNDGGRNKEKNKETVELMERDE